MSAPGAGLPAQKGVRKAIGGGGGAAAANVDPNVARYVSQGGGAGTAVAGAAGGGAPAATNPYVTQTGAAPAGAPYVSQSATQTAGAHGHGAGGAGTLAGHEGHGHNSILYALRDSIPTQNAFIKGSLGADAGTNFNLAAGAGFKGKAGRDPNGADQAQNNLKKADANRPAYGIPATVAGTNQKPNYVQDIQVSIGMGALEALRPDVLQYLIDKQNAGQGSVWNGVAYMTGLIDQHDGSVGPELEQIRAQVMNQPVGQSGKTVAQWAENPKDQNGTNWARSNHAMTGIKAYLQLEQSGIPTKAALDIANNDDLVSGAGRIDWIAPGRASNNQENTFTGMNGAERKEWNKAATTARELGRPDILRTMMDSHTMGSHMLTQYGNKGAKSKVDGNLGIDPNMSVEQRKQTLVNYFLNNPKDPKKGEQAKGGGAPPAAAPPVKQNVEAPAVAGAAGGGAPEQYTSNPGVPGQAGGCGMDHGAGGVGQLSGGGGIGAADLGSIQAVLAQLVQTLNQLVALLSASTTSVAGASGGGPLQQPPVVQAGGGLAAAPAPAAAAVAGGGGIGATPTGVPGPPPGAAPAPAAAHAGGAAAGAHGH